MPRALRDHRQRRAQQHARDPRRDERGDRRDLHVAPSDESGRTRRSAVAAAVRGGAALPPGPVVASGGAPPAVVAGAIRRAVLSRARRHGGQQALAGRCGGREAATRYQSGYNVMGTSTKPPYTTITAYDLNTGEIKWQVPNGDDPATVEMTTTRPGNRVGPLAAVCPEACMTPAASARATAWWSRSPACCSRSARTASRAPMTWIPARSCGRAPWRAAERGIPVLYESKGRAVRRVHVAGARRRPAGGRSAAAARRRRRLDRTATSRSRSRHGSWAPTARKVTHTWLTGRRGMARCTALPVRGYDSAVISPSIGSELRRSCWLVASRCRC